MRQQQPPDVSVIVPAHNAARTLGRCLEALLAAADARTEVIVVDDGSRDATPIIADRYPVRLAHTGCKSGAAAARNLGATLARGEVLVYVDADVLVPPDTITRLRATFAHHPHVAVVVGSYAADTPEAGFFTVYKNLQAHYVHQTYRRPFPYFVGFAGAIRRGVFWAVGGFDASAYPAGATVEDVELGHRLRAAGHCIWLDRDWQVTHLKRYTFGGLLRSDLLGRCIPFVRLRLRTRSLGPEPSTDVHNVLSVAAVGLALVAVVAAVVRGLGPALVGAVVAGAVAACLVLNLDFYRFTAQRRPFVFVLGTLGFDLFGHAYRLLGLALGLLVGVSDAWRVARVGHPPTRDEQQNACEGVRTGCSAEPSQG